jgi:predicted nucleic-acid-binding protein
VRAVDTNVLVRLITRDDTRQVAAAERFVATGAWVSLLALTEATWVLDSVYDLDANEIATAVDMLLSHERLTIQDHDVVAAAVDRLRAVPRLGFSDCLMLEVARKAGHLPLGTFDRRFGRIEGTERI